MDIEGLTAVVTGGASGLGAATAKMLADLGAKVTILDLNAEAGHAYASLIGGGFCALDVTDESAVTTAFDAIAAEHGPARILVNCAGIAPRIVLLRTDETHPIDVFRKTLDVNVTGTFICVTRFAERLRAVRSSTEDYGIIINTASIVAWDGQFGQSAYAASKAAIVGMTLPLARDLAVERIRVVTIAPGVFDTPMTGNIPRLQSDEIGAQVPHPARLGGPNEFAHIVESAIGNPYLNAAVIRLDGGLRLGPH